MLESKAKTPAFRSYFLLQEADRHTTTYNSQQLQENIMQRGGNGREGRVLVHILRSWHSVWHITSSKHVNGGREIGRDERRGEKGREGKEMTKMPHPIPVTVLNIVNRLVTIKVLFSGPWKRCFGAESWCFSHTWHTIPYMIITIWGQQVIICPVFNSHPTPRGSTEQRLTEVAFSESTSSLPI